MSMAPILDVEELRVLHEPFIREHTNPRAIARLLASLPRLSEPDQANRLPVIWADDLLRRRSVRSLGSLVFDHGRCLTAHQHPVAGPLLNFMIDVSRFGITQHPLEQPRWTAKQLSCNPADPSLSTYTPPHCDHADGNAVTFNFNVKGLPQALVTTQGQRVDMLPNRLIVLGGQYQFIRQLGHYGTIGHWSETQVDIDKGQRPGNEARERLLAYVDGQDTGHPTDYTFWQPLSISFEVMPRGPLSLLRKLIH